jgi:transcriptional regulator with XRE-family HTH domain
MNTTRQVTSRQHLVAERLRRHWTQLEVADRLGTTPGNVSRWERGITSPGPYFRRRLCEVFGRSTRELGLIWDESDEVLSPRTKTSVLAASFREDAPARSSSPLADRGNLLVLLHSLMRPDRPEALQSVLAPSGPGELNGPQQESLNQAWLARTVAQSLHLENMGAVVLVVLNGSVGSRPSSVEETL